MTDCCALNARWVLEQAKPFQAPSWWRGGGQGSGSLQERPASPRGSGVDADKQPLTASPDQPDSLTLLRKQRERWAAYAGAQPSHDDCCD